jgi:ABC-type multidrug transport system fused ATPase/permease subunit
MNSIQRSLTYLKPHWKLAVISLVLIVLSSFAVLLAPWPLKVLIDNVAGTQPLPSWLAVLFGPWSHNRVALLIITIAAGLGITLLSNGLAVLESYVNTNIDQRIVLDFRSQLFDHAQRLSLTFHDQERSGMIIYAINFQADAAAQLVMTVPPVGQAFLTLIGMFIVTFSIEPRLALLSLIVVPLLYACIRYYVSHIQNRLTEVKMMEGETLSIIHEAISMLRVIVAFGREGYEYRRFRNQGEKALHARVHLTVRQTLFSLAVNTSTAIGSSLVMGYGFYEVIMGRLTAGQLLVVIAYVAAVYTPLETISTTIGSIQDQLVSLRMAYELLDTKPEIHDAPHAKDVRGTKGEIAFDNVSFSYRGRSNTLRNISFDVKAGQVVALVGPTGAGKTTLISLIPRFYEPHEGRVLLDGTDIKDLTLRSLRRQISLVLQEPLLFSGSIAENIRYGRLDATMDDIMEAAKSANAHDFIMRLPEQYETLLGERGVQLSGGERQRIAIARAFIKDAPILILDEPTSSIDSRTEAVILDALDRLMVGRTTFMVAHRLSTIRHADVILVVHQGRLVESGTHDELLERDGLYRQLHDIQTRQAQRRARQPVGAAQPSGAA